MTDDRNPGPRRTTIAVAVASLLIAVSIIVVVTELPVDPPPTTTGESRFDGFAASKVGYEWWNSVRRDDLSAFSSLTHQGSDIAGFPDIPLARDPDVTITVDAVPFGSLSQPQLCYILTGSTGQETGSMVFRAEGEGWLVWEIRTNVDSCYVPVGPDL